MNKAPNGMTTKKKNEKEGVQKKNGETTKPSTLTQPAHKTKEDVRYFHVGGSYLFICYMHRPLKCYIIYNALEGAIHL